MMDIFTYRCTGAETKSGGNTIIYAPPVSGMPITNLFVNGVGLAFSTEDVDSSTTRILLPGLLGRGSLIQLLFKKLPRFNIPTPPVTGLTDFEIADFESADFE